MSRAVYEVALDMDGDELFETIVTSDVIPPPGASRDSSGQFAGGAGLLMKMSRGHDQARVLTPPKAGQSRCVLKNATGAYAAALLLPGCQVRVRATFDGTRRDILRGILARPVQSPVTVPRKTVNADIYGTLSRLARKTVDTALYSSITTDVAIGHVLDAGGWPKNLPQYLLDQAPALLLSLGEASGSALDSSGNGLNGTVTIGAGGARDYAALDDGGDGCIDFDGTNTQVLVPDAAPIQNIWDGGGAVAFLLNADTFVGDPIMVKKGNITWSIATLAESAGTAKMRLGVGFSGTNGGWDTTNRIFQTGRTYLVIWIYNADSVANDPTLFVYDLTTETFTTYAVSSGLTESGTPVGTRTTDVAGDVVIGRHPGAALNGRMDEVALFTALLTSAQAKRCGARAHDAPRHLDVGKTTLDWFWLDHEDAMSALAILKNTEGPGAALYEDGTGAIVFKSRHARVLDSRSTAIQTTFRSAAGGTEPLISQPFEYDIGLKDVVNDCTVTVLTRAAQSSAQVWALGSTVTLAPGESRSYVARQSDSDPFTAAATPTTGAGDYTVASGSLSSVSLDRTSGAEVTITLLAGASGASITGLRLRAQSVEVTTTTTVANTADTSASRAQYGIQTYQLTVRSEIPVNTAQDFCNAVAGFYKNGRPRATVTLRASQADARMTAALAREVSDRVRVIVGSDVDEEFFVEEVSHQVLAPAEQVTTFGLEASGAAATYFVLGVSALDDVDGLAW